jgi:hypothetical protein
MCEDVVLTDENGRRYSYENIRTQSWLDGHLHGMEAAAGWLRRKASRLFEAGRNKEAVVLRNMANDMAKELGVSLKAQSSTHREAHPEVIAED